MEDKFKSGGGAHKYLLDMFQVMPKSFMNAD